MARITTQGFEGWETAIEKIASMPDDVAREILDAQASVVIKEQKARAPRNTGKLASSVSATKMKYNREGARVMYVYPRGTHHTYRQYGTGKEIRVRNAEVGFIQEYGAPQKGIRATGWVSAANAAAEDEAIAEAEKVLGEFLEQF